MEIYFQASDNRQCWAVILKSNTKGLHIYSIFTSKWRVSRGHAVLGDSEVQPDCAFGWDARRAACYEVTLDLL